MNKQAVGPRIILIALFLVGVSAGPACGAEVEYTFSWEDNHPNDNVTAYRIYWRTLNGTYNATDRQELSAADLRPQPPQWPATLTASITITVADPNERMFFVCTAVDEDGFESDYSNEAPPSVAFSNLEADFIINGGNYSAFLIEGEGNPGDTIEVYVNGDLLASASVAADGTWSIAADFTAIDEGPVVLTATAAGAGVSTDPIAGVFDRTAPAFTETPTTAGISYASATIAWKTNEQSDSQVRYSLTGGYSWDFYPKSTASAVMETNHSLEIAGLTPETTYYYRAGSTDASGNLKTSGEISFTTTAAPDTTPPEISSVLASSKSHNSTTIQWNTNEISDSALRVGTASGAWDSYSMPAVSSSVLESAHALTAGGLSADQDYFFRVRSTDASGNTATSAEGQFTTDPQPDTTPPVIHPPAVESKTDTSATIYWTTDEPADSYVDYGLTMSYGRSWEDSDFATEHRATLTGLSAATTYHYQVSSTDDDGNGPSLSADGTFITDATPDTAPPVITSAISVTDRQDTRATIVWNTDEPANAQVRYGLSDQSWDGYTLEKTDTAMTTGHAVTLTGLDPSTVYFFRVGSTDAAGNGPVVSNSQRFNTTPDPDVTAPVITSQPVVVDATGTSAAIRWQTDEPANSQVQYGTDGPGEDSWGAYPFLANSTAMVTAHDVSLSGLVPDTTYYLRAGSTDVANNGPTVSTEISFTTLAAADTQPPTFTSPPAVTARTNTSATIEWQTDEPANSLVQYDRQSRDWDAYSHSQSDAQLKTVHSIQLTGLDSGAVYYARIGGVDAAGNGPAVSHEISFSTQTAADTADPVITAPPTVTSITESRATITWETDEMSNSQVRFDTTAQPWDGYSLRKDDPDMVKRHSVTVASLSPDTVYQFQVGSTDAADNGPTLSNAASFKTNAAADTQAPEFTVPPTVTGIGSDSVTIEWSTNEPANSQVQYDTASSDWGSYGSRRNDAQLVTDHRIVLTGLLPGEDYYFRAGSLDGADNGPVVSREFDFTTETDEAPPAPRITSPPTVTKKTNNSATIAWQTDKPSNSEVRYGRSEKTPWSAYPSIVLDNAMVTQHKVVLTGLDAETVYYYRVGSTDAAGAGPSDDAEETNNPFVEEVFVTERTPDNKAPEILSKPTVTGIDAHSAIVEWETDEPGNSVVGYDLRKEDWDLFTLIAQDDRMVTRHSVTLTGLTELTTYHLRAGSFDEAGNGPVLNSNSSNPSAVVSFKTLEDVDTAAPQISNMVMTWATNTTALIEWDTDEPANSSVKYENADNPDAWETKKWSEYLFAENDADMQTHHSVTITGLQPSTTYYFRVGSTDAKGNGPDSLADDLNPSAEGFFVSADGPDKSAPQVSNIKIDPKISDRTAVVSWVTDEPGNSQVQYATASSNWGQYAFSENDGGMVKNHSVTLTDLELDVLYYMRVSSVDASGNNYTASNEDKNPSIEYNFKLSKKDTTAAAAADGGGSAGTSCFVESLMR